MTDRDMTPLEAALLAALGRAVKDIPAKVAAEIAAERDPARVAEILHRALVPALAIIDRLDEVRE